MISIIVMHCVPCYYTIHYLLVVGHSFVRCELIAFVFVRCLVDERTTGLCRCLCCCALPESVTATPPAEAGLLLRAKIAAPLNDFLAGERES